MHVTIKKHQITKGDSKRGRKGKRNHKQKTVNKMNNRKTLSLTNYFKYKWNKFFNQKTD